MAIATLIGLIFSLGFLIPVAAKSTKEGIKDLSPPQKCSLPHGLEKQKAAKGKLLSGIASWYGIPFHGRRTASGQIFDMNKLTAAHPTLPLCSKVLVENPHNGKSVVININDRGPYIKNRVIDLSREAAKQLGILSNGLAYVNYTVLPSEPQIVTLSSTAVSDE